MVIDKLAYLDLYKNLHPRFEKAFAFFKELCEKNVPDGKYVLDGTEQNEEIFVNFTTIETKFSDRAVAEVHGKYIDVQIVLDGDEVMYVPAKDLTVVGEHPENDCGFYESTAIADCNRLEIGVGRFAIFFAGEAHAPGHGRTEKTQKIRKAIIKILQ